MKLNHIFQQPITTPFSAANKKIYIVRCSGEKLYFLRLCDYRGHQIKKLLHELEAHF
jgi:hypothetical protein